MKIRPLYTFLHNDNRDTQVPLGGSQVPSYISFASVDQEIDDHSEITNPFNSAKEASQNIHNFGVSKPSVPYDTHCSQTKEQQELICQF